MVSELPGRFGLVHGFQEGDRFAAELFHGLMDVGQGG